MSWKNRPAAILIALLIMLTLAQVDRNILLGFSPQIIGDLGLTNTQYGVLVGAVWVVSYGFMALFLGSMADRFSRTRIIAFGLLIWSVCTVASGFAHSFYEMVAARFLVATGEAALVPAGTALLMEVFNERRRGTAMGVFFMGIPVGSGLSFVLAGSLGHLMGWRNTFIALGVCGVMMAVPLLFLKDEREQGKHRELGAAFIPQVKALWAIVRENRRLPMAILGFVMINGFIVGFSFSQLWLVKERGFGASIATTFGALFIVFGTLGALAGGILTDRLATKFRGGIASVMMLVILAGMPLVVAYRIGLPGTPLFYAGMCATFFLPLAAYGPGVSLIQGMVPNHMRSTVTGFTMLALNMIANALGNLFAGKAVDMLTQAGQATPYSTVVLGTDLLACTALFFFMAARTKAPVTATGNALP
jgi:predicted MFS family arabinose efflux permease